MIHAIIWPTHVVCFSSSNRISSRIRIKTKTRINNKISREGIISKINSSNNSRVNHRVSKINKTRITNNGLSPVN